MIKKNKYLLISLAVLTSIFIFLFIQSKSAKPIEKLECKNKDYEISLTLKSGEKGKVYLLDNRCEPNSVVKDNNLSFKVLADGALEDSIYQSKLYFWTRDNNLTVEAQIKSIADKLNKNKLCAVERNQYTQHDGLETYSLMINHKANNDCMLFGNLSDFSSEIYMTNNGLLIAQRQDGMDGIEPFNLSSLRFVRD
ncbi:MAG: hypothetical protein NTY12_03515 [Candidatus Falkowbacteria bacterium]|nr:hypothetical protein [Candidatus Falkowbacteria bacterium]